ncbi:hypothetical protein [Kitasatospora sp. NPDC057223]|uniref:hypothetical protein n=1 Tax=Kitasatospora sp. NPDC057223 TaxID=3346055 RepID=UPI003640E1DD
MLKFAKWGPFGVIALLMLGLVGVGVLTGASSCWSGAADRLGSALAKEPVLAAHPAGSEPVSGGTSSCDADDGHVEAWQDYRLSIPDAEALAFYRDAAVGGGWRPVEGRRSPCYAKEVGGSTAYLYTGRPTEGDLFAVTITADTDGSPWC